MAHFTYNRRNAVKKILAAPALATAGFLPGPLPEHATHTPNYKISLNAYSFNEPLRTGKMNLDELLDFCALHRFDAVDLTAYYFPGYPAVPPDAYLYRIKHKAFRLGLAISGTGVRNDFTHPETEKRRESVALVKNWIDATAKLGAPVIRIFSGTQNPTGFTREQILAWMIPDIQECVAHGKSKGVVVAIQNHHDFIKTAAETRQIINLVNSDWFGLILDIGSYRQGDPYAEIKSMIPHAVSWQIKEEIYVNGTARKPDLAHLFNLIKTAGYRGYLPIETLGPGDPKLKVAGFLDQVRKALAA